MEVKTINPVLVNPDDTNINGYGSNKLVNLDLKGQTQDVNVGDFIVKGTNPVFIDDKEASQNEFLYSEPIVLGSETLTPNDEYLYSNLTAEERRTRRQERRMSREQAKKVARAKANETTPGNGEPTKEEQDAKAKEGKFWNVLKGGWDSFTKSPSGQIILDSATNYIANKLGGAGYSQQGAGLDDTPPADDKSKDEPMSKTTKYVLIGGGVLLLGIILYTTLSKK